MGHQAVLAGFGQVVRQQQNAVGAQALGFLRAGHRKTGRAADAGNDGHLAGAGINRRLDDQRVFVAGEREKFARAASGKKRGRAVRGQPFEALDVAARAKIALLVKVGDGKGQKAGADDGCEVLGVHKKFFGKKLS